MNKLSIDLENCYGISALQAELDFSKNNVYAVYASNGIMKTSLAKTFIDVSNDKPSGDEIYPEKEPKRDIIIDDANLKAEDVFVLKSYAEPSEWQNDNVATLLINPKLKKEYDQAYNDIKEAKDNFLEEIVSLSGKTPQEIQSEVSKIFYHGDEGKFFEALKRVKDEVLDNTEPKYKNIIYSELFNDKTEEIIESDEFRENIKSYVEVYNRLLTESNFFRQGVFNHVQASDIAKQLKQNGFFEAEHSVLLKGEQQPIKTGEELEEKIEGEKVRIIENAKLKDEVNTIFNELDKKLKKNKILQKFREYLSDNPQITSDFINVERLKSKLWIGYFKEKKELFKFLLTTLEKSEAAIKTIRRRAEKDRAIWHKVIDEFNEKFFVPFSLHVSNRVEVMLDNHAEPVVAFKFDDEEVGQEKLRKVLSQGEKRALHILNILFDIKAEEKKDNPCLLIVDDIADSFDYKNKFAIVEYLKEISEIKIAGTEKNKFYLVILTHNFDFFRTLALRGVASRKTCLIAEKNESGITLEVARYIKNPFVEWQKMLSGGTTKHKTNNQNKYFVASVPFVRNMIEYQKREDEGYNTLSKLLHYREDSGDISLKDVKGLFLNCGIALQGIDPDKKIQEIILETAEQCSKSKGKSSMMLEDKIVLSIAIRIIAEKCMAKNLAAENISFDLTGTEKETGKLFGKYKKEFSGKKDKEKNIKILKQVVLMVPSNIHLNSFMYEPILDMGAEELQKLYSNVKDLT